MRKKIFKVVGIVLAAALAFIGVVVGIMAIRGKFKTKNIYPTELIFVDDEIDAVNYYDNSIHSFTITGLSSNDKKVNKTNCYIYFVDRVNGQNFYGEDLIMLCQKDGTPLAKQANSNKYKVKCNEPIYYKLRDFGTNPAHFEKENYGIAKLQADDERGMVKSNILTIKVDQTVEQIKLKGYDYQTKELNNKEYGEQNIDLSLGSVLDFDLEFLPNYSLHPITDVANKKVEIYHYNGSRFETGRLDNDYELIGEQFLQKPENNFVKYITNENDEQMLRFEPVTEGGSHTFIIAVFDSYFAEQNFVQTRTNYQKVDQMIYTVVNVNVISDNVETVEFKEDLRNGNEKVTLNLYKGNNYITLNGYPSLENVENENINNNDLGLLIDGATVSHRFDAVAFGTNLERFWAYSNISFKDAENRTLTFNLNSNNKFVTLTDFDDLDGTYEYSIIGNSIRVDQIGISFDISKGTIKLDNGTIINNLTYNGENVEFNCSNGAAFAADNGSIIMLRTGSYLEFFNKVENNFEKTTFDYSATAFGVGENRSFNIVVKELPETENLALVLLVVNSNGELLTASADVLIEEQKSSLQFDNLKNDINVGYDVNGNAIYGEIKFEDIASFVDGSYSSGVFVTQKVDKYSIEVLDYISFELNERNNNLNGTYVLVGYIDENGEFVNAVKARNKDALASTTIYALQLKNEYGQTTEQTIGGILNELNPVSLNDFVFDFSFININYAFVVENNYDIHSSSITWNFNESAEYESGEGKDEYIIKDENGAYHVLEKTGQDNTDSHKIEISSSVENMLYNLSDINQNNVKIYTRNNGILSQSIYNNISIINLTFDADKFVIEFSVDNYIQNTCYVFGIEFDENKTIYSPDIYIDCNEAKNILMNNNVLSNDEYDSNMPTLNINIGYDTGLTNYTYTYTINDQAVNFDNFFNTTFAKNQTNFGFAPSPAFSSTIKDYSFTFTSKSPEILTFNAGQLKINQITGREGCVVSVTCVNNNYQIVRYFRIIITASAGFNFVKNEDAPTEINDNTQVDLINFVKYSYNGVSLEDTKYFTISNLKSTNENYVQSQENPLVLVDKINENATVISIEQADEKWVIKKSAEYNYRNIAISFDVSVQTNETINVEFMFTYDITAELNFQYYDSFYAGTRILLAEKVQKIEDLKNQPMFVIKDKTGASFKIKYYENQAEQETSTFDVSDTITVHNLIEGRHIYRIYLLNGEQETLINTFSITVLPNVKISQTSPQNEYGTKMLSNNSYAIDDLVTLERYNTTIIYGQKNASGAFNLYNQMSLIKFKDLEEPEQTQAYNNLNFKDSTLVYDASTKTFKTSWIENLDEIIRKEVVLTYSSANFPINVIISNSYSSKLQTNYETNETNVISISARQIYNSLFKIEAEDEDWKLTNVKCTVYEIDGSVTELSVSMHGNQFEITNFLSKNYTNAKFEFTFSCDGKPGNLIYCNLDNENITDKNIEITVKPYAPNFKDEILAYSEQSFNLVTGVFDILDAEQNQKQEYKDVFNSISIERVSDASLLSSTWQGPYTTNPNTTSVTIAKINGDSKILTVYYLIEYIDGPSFSLSKDITILNYQSIETNYPFKNFAAEDDANGITLSFSNLDTAETSSQELQQLGRNLKSYEPVSTNQTLSFDYDNLMSINRVVMANRIELQSVPSISQVKLVAYSGPYNSNMVTIDSNNNVTFNNFGNATQTYLVFKIITNSGNYAYYVVKFYNNAANPSYSQVSPKNHSVEINNINNVYYNKEENKFYVLGNEIDLVNQFGVSSLTGNINLYLYLLDYEANEKLSVDYVKNELLNDKSLVQYTGFVKLKIALVMDNGIGVELYLGNINAYIKPNVEIKTNGTVRSQNGNVETGKFYADWNSKMFENPFVTGASPIVNIEEVLTAGFSTDGSKITYGSVGDVVTISNTTSLERLMYVTIPLEFVVKYEYINSLEGLVLYVHVIMTAIETPTNPPAPYTVGNFDGTKFVDELNINCYDGKIDITNILINNKMQSDIITSSTGWQRAETRDIVTFNRDESGKLVLKFALSNKYVPVSFDVKYVDIANTNQISVHIEIDVAAAIDVQFESNVGQDINPLKAISTQENGKFDYSNANASKISIEKSAQNNLTVYSVGGLKITTLSNNAELQIDLIDNEEYVVNYSNNITVNDSKDIQFTHSAKEVKLALNIKILDSGSSYANKMGEISQNLYVLVPQTYIGLTPTYMLKIIDSTRNTNHENVSSGSTIENIRSKLLGNVFGSELTDVVKKQTVSNEKRLALRYFEGTEEKTTFDYAGSMGFAIKNNPNYLDITDGEYNHLISNGENLSFDPVVDNTYSTIVLENKSGITPVVYRYQILANSQSDGLSVISSDKYISSKAGQTINYAFVVDATGNFSTENYEIASLLDLNNQAFYITACKAEKDGNSQSLLQKDDETDQTTSRFATNSTIVYSLIFPNYKLTLTKTATEKITVLFENLTDTKETFSVYSIELTLYGEGGLIGILQLNFYNCKITNPEQINMYSGTKIDITNLFKEAVVNISNVEYEYDEENSSYAYMGAPTTGVKNSNKVFAFEKTDNKYFLDIHPLSSNATAILSFKVLINSIHVSYIQIGVNITCNFAFYENYTNSVDNGVTEGNGFNINSTTPNSASTFNYYLNDENNKYTITLSDQTTYNETSKTPILKNESSYYSKINIMLYHVNDKSPFDIATFHIFVCDQTGKEVETYTITQDANQIKLNLKSDFSGTILLKLVAGTLDDNDKYVRYINVKVLGYLTFEYTGTKGQNQIQEGSGAGFKSGTSVYTIDQVIDPTKGVGLTSFTTNKNYFTKDDPTINESTILNENTIKINYAKVRYSVNLDENIKSAYEAVPEAERTKVTFEGASEDNKEVENLLIKNGNSLRLKLTLPMVDSSMDNAQRDYFVIIYKIEIPHLPSGTDTYYVSYRVYNEKTLKINGTNNIINVEEENKLFNKEYLRLFQFSVDYTEQGTDNKYVMYYYFEKFNSKGIIKLRTPEGEDYTLRERQDDSDDLNYIFVKDDKTITIPKSSQNGNFKITLSDDGPKEIQTTRSVTQTDANVLYLLSDTTIETFKEKIDMFRNENAIKLKQNDDTTEKTYTLEMINEDGRIGLYGIKLSKYNNLFTNEFVGVIKIEPGNINLDTTSLNLITNSKLTAKGKFKLSQIFTTISFTGNTNLEVIGVTKNNSPSSKWVNGATTASNNGEITKINEETIPTLSSGITVHIGTWTGTGGAFYSISEKFYYLSGADSINSISYNTAGSVYFVVPYVVGKTSSISVEQMYFTFANNSSSGTFEKKPVSNATLTADSPYNQYIKGKTIEVSEVYLTNYKKSNPNEDYMVVKCSINGQEIEIRFVLPDLPAES